MPSNITKVYVRSLTAAGIGALAILCSPAFGKELQVNPGAAPLAGDAAGSVGNAASASNEVQVNQRVPSDASNGDSSMTSTPSANIGPRRAAVMPLLTIDQNRSTLVDRIIREWGGAIAQLPDGITPDQLREVLSSMRADRLLTASLAGSAEGLRGVITGALADERGAEASFVQSKAIGDIGIDLDYVPVVPCRLVETRGTFPAVYQGGGAFASNAIRTYTLQGGNGVCLTQLPAGANPGAIQLQVYGIPTTSGSGDIEILPQGSTFGSTATLVYLGNNAFTSSSTTSRVNTTNNQISVQVRGGGAHVAIDVVGYFRSPQTINLVSGGGPSIKTTSTSGFNSLDIDAANGDAALRFYKGATGLWNVRNRPADDYFEIFELNGGGSRVVIQDGTGNVGIGGVDPNYRLDVLHGGATGLRVKSSSTYSIIDIDADNGDAAIRFQKAGVGQWNIRNEPSSDNFQIFELGGGGERLRIENGTGDVVVSGAIGIGISPSFQLQLSANSAAKPTSNTWTIASDMRVKENIVPFTDGLSTLLKINPVSYDLNGKAGLPKGEHGISVIAQEAREVVPYMVSSFKAKLNPDDVAATDVLSFDSGALSFVTVNAIKELVVMMGQQAATKDAEIDQLKRKNAAMEARLAAIEKALESK